MPTHEETLDIRSLSLSLRNQIHPNKLYGCQVQNNALQGSVYWGY